MSQAIRIQTINKLSEVLALSREEWGQACAALGADDLEAASASLAAGAALARTVADAAADLAERLARESRGVVP